MVRDRGRDRDRRSEPITVISVFLAYIHYVNFLAVFTA